MREIKSSGRRVDNGKWVEGSFVKNHSSCSICVISTTQAGARRFYKVIPETVGQYIGRTDKNDKEIFENCIVDICYKGIHYATATVKYDNNQFVLDTPGYVLSQSVWEDNDYSFEVIGNIHDKPRVDGGKQ